MILWGWTILCKLIYYCDTAESQHSTKYCMGETRLKHEKRLSVQGFGYFYGWNYFLNVHSKQGKLNSVSWGSLCKWREKTHKNRLGWSSKLDNYFCSLCSIISGCIGKLSKRQCVLYEGLRWKRGCLPFPVHEVEGVSCTRSWWEVEAEGAPEEAVVPEALAL